jgi:hypothetical protein
MTPEDAIRRRQRSYEEDDRTGAAASDWSSLLGRVVEDLSRIFQLELRLLESRMALSLSAMADRAFAAMIVVFAGAIGGCCLLTALIMLLHQWLPWWQSLAISGGVPIAAGVIAYAVLNCSVPPAEPANPSTS